MSIIYQPIRWDGGVNLLSDAEALAPNEVRESRNLYPRAPGRLARRGAMAFVGAPLTTVPSLGAPVVQFARGVASTIPPWAGSTLLAALAARNLTTDTQTGYGSGTTSLVLLALDAVESAAFTVGRIGPWAPSLLSYNRKLYCFAGYTASVSGAILEAASGGAGYTMSAFEFAGSGNTEVRPRVAGVYRNRMVFANFGPGFENHVVVSDLYDPTLVGDDVLAVNGRNFIVGDTSGDEIVAVHEVMLSGAGSPAQSALLVLKRYGAYLINGEPSQTTDTGDYLGSMEIVKLGVAAGCASPLTIRDTPEGLFWAGPDQVWCYRPGGLPFPVGDKIAPRLASLPAETQYRWHAAYHAGFYRLATFSPEQGINHDAPCGEQWWMDIRRLTPGQPPPMSWWGPMVYSIDNGNDELQVGTYNMMEETRPNQPAALYGIEAGMVISQADDGYMQVQYDAALGYDLMYPITPSAWGLRRASALGKIDVLLRTGDMNFGDPHVDKLLVGIEADVFMSLEGAIDADVILTGGTKTGAEMTAHVPALGFRTAISTVDDLIGKSPVAVSIDPVVEDENDDRPVSPRIQVAFSHRGEIVDPLGDSILLTYKLAGVETQVAIDPSDLQDQTDLFQVAQDFQDAVNLAAGANVVLVGLNGSEQLEMTRYPLSSYTLRLDWDQNEATRIFAALLGFQASGAPSFFTTLAATEELTTVLSPDLEISTIVAKIRAFRRRPTR